MKKKLFILLLILILPVCLLFVGCTIPSSSVTAQKNGAEFNIGDITLVKVEQSEHFAILVDKETKIMYLLYADNTTTNWGIAGITVMLNADGTPMLWEGEL